MFLNTKTQEYFEGKELNR